MAVLLKSALYEAVGWSPHKGQIPVLKSVARSNVLAAGRRFGKSEVGAYDRLLPAAFMAKQNADMILDLGQRYEYWIIGPEYSDGEKEFRKLYNALKRCEVPFDSKRDTDGIGTRYNAESGDMAISLWGGAFYVTVKSAKYPDSLIGEGLRGVVLAEAAKLKASVYDKYIRPTLADYKGWMLATSTPEGKNWFHEFYLRGKDPKYPGWASWKIPAWHNPHVYPGATTPEGIKLAQKWLDNKDPIGLTAERRDLLIGGMVDEEILDLMQTMTEERFNQEIAADFSEYVGRVFKAWDEEIHVTDLAYNPNPRWFTCAAIDYGFTNPFVWLLIQVDVWGNVYVLDEIYERGLTIPEAIQMVKDRELAPDSLSIIYPDPEDPGASRQISQKLRVKIGGNTGGRRRDRIDLIRAALKRVPVHLPNDHPEKQPRLFVDRRCRGLIADMDAYRYPDTKNERGGNDPEEPMKKDDHGPEALGRFFRGYFGVGDLSKRKTELSTARMGR